MNRFAVFLISQSNNSLIYLIVPSSLPDISSDSKFNTSISNFVILSFNDSIFFDNMSLFCWATFNWSSNALLLPVLALVITCPDVLSIDWVVVFVDSAFLKFVMSLSNTNFSVWCSFFISSNLSFFTSMFLIFLLLISNFAMFEENPVLKSP